MVAPLHVGVVVVDEEFHDLVGVFSAVEDVAHDVQAVYREPLDEVCYGDDERLRPAEVDDRGKDLPVIRLLVEIVAVHVDQLVDDVVEIGGQRLADFAARIFRRHRAAHLHEAVQLYEVPILIGGALRLLFRDDRGGIVDQRGKFVALSLGHGLPVQAFDLFPDDPRTVVHDVAERLELAVEVAHEMLRTFRQAEDRLEVDHLRRRRL